MPPITRVITTRSRNVPARTIRALHTELAAIGLPVAGEEASGTPRFGSDTKARVREFQQLHGLPKTGKVDRTTGGIMSLSAFVATEVDRSKLRKKLKAAVGNVPNSPDYNYWLARYAVMSGDYALAKKVSPRLIDLSGVRVDLGNAVFNGTGPGSPQEPDVPFPENFYSYRYNLMSQQDIDELRIKNQFSGTMPFMARATQPNGGPGEPPPPPLPPPGVPDPPPTTTPGMSRQERLAASAIAFLNAIEAWQLGNSEFSRQRYASAVQAHNRCQQAILDYFSVFPDYNLQFTTNTLDERVDELVWRLASDRQTWSDVWAQINWRRQLLSLAELGQFDWTPITGGRYASIVYQLLEGNLAGSDQPPPPTNPIGPEHRKILIDAHLLIIAAILVPLARGEVNRLRRQFVDGRADFSRVLRRSIPIPNNTTLNLTVSLACEFIEIPFARLLLIETILDQAEAQYKSRLSVDDEPDPPTKSQELARIGQIAQEFTNDNIPGDSTPGAPPLQHLVAAITYADALATMQEDGEYVVNTKQALKSLHDNVTSALGGGDVSSIAFRSIAQGVTIPNVTAVAGSLPGLTSGTFPHEPYLQFNSSDGQPIRQRNPRVYGLLLQAQSRLLQIWSGFNYLGYRDDYVPPWRFQYLLDRARYFAEHAKNAQRDYLNFLNNAENEEFKEMSAAQNVELEKANVRIESARVDQAADQVTASQQSKILADLNASDAATRLQDYQDFNTKMDELNSVSALSAIGSIALGIGEIAVTGGVGTAQGTQTILGGVSSLAAAGKEELQRYLEEDNLTLAVGEANQAAAVADAQLQVANAGLVVAGLQRQAALLRHEFALQNLQFIRNRTLNTEQWYRLAGAIRSVSDTYLRYGISIAFLGQQAYNFESDKRLNVIRFDYDLSDVGAWLAADFLLRDLDGLEQDLVVSQRTRLQQVRYVLSMAREFPETLKDLADNGQVQFSVRLEQLERHFPGLLNLRISNVDVQLVALMDPTRVSVELTQLGSGMIRLKSQPGTSPLNSTDVPANGDWISNSGIDWPIKIHISGPETTVFSGLSRQEAGSLSTVTASERAPFEGLPAASSWRIDMSMKENQVVPGTLADVVITFSLAGYYDSSFNEIVMNAASSGRALATTNFISARRALPDAYYSLAHNGNLNWDISDDMLSLQGTPGALRNLAVFVPLVSNGPEVGRCCCRYPIQIQISAGAVDVLTFLPEFTLSQNGLTLDCTYSGLADVTWDFGDNSAVVQGSTAQHSYARTGRYTLLARLSKNGTLTEYRSAVVVSTNNAVGTPLIVAPVLSAGAASSDGTVPLTISLAAAMADVSFDCSAAGTRASADSGSAVLNLKPGSYMLDFLAMRKLFARFYGKQRYLPTQVVDLYRGRVATNRTFDVASGTETTTSPDAFSTQLFGNGNIVLSPVDRWTLELPLADNPWFMSVSPSDIAEFDGSELADAVLVLEFLSTQ